MVNANVVNGTLPELISVVFEGKKDSDTITADTLEKYMTAHKSLWSMRVLEANAAISYPANIIQAVEACI